MRIIATAGHVDHGKSTLLRALTGIDPDRWEEERRRGMTIDLGFAHMRLADGTHISFIDVPGHIRFISNMLAGVGGIHGCLFVVDAREGWMPQTEEHLRILDLVGVRHGVIALTKIDLVDDDTRELAALDIAERVRDTFLADAPIVPVTSLSGFGLDAIAAELSRLADVSSPSLDRGLPRLFVDRVFTVTGSGTVVTGTLTDGTFTVGDTVTITPGMFDARIRAIQSLGASCDAIGPGHRVALNLADVDHGELRRGDVVIAPNAWHITNRVDARLDVLGGLDHAVSRRGAFTVHIGSDDISARLRVLGRERIAPGDSGFVRLFLDRPLPLLPGDRFVLRESGRSETVGGGEILDVDPVLPASRARPDRSVERVIAERGLATAHTIRLLTGENPMPTVGDWVLSPDELARHRASIDERLDESGDRGLDLSQLDEVDRSLLGISDDVVIDNGWVRRRGTEDPLLDHPVIERLRLQRCAPEACSDIPSADLRRLERLGLVFESQGEWFHMCALEDARGAARRLLDQHVEGFTVSQFRETLGITRKHAVPLASALDARGITRRRGDVRIAGPRLSGSGER